MRSHISGYTIYQSIERGFTMSKGQSVKKGSKKEPAKSMKEKKSAKRDKKNEKMHPAVLELK
jgi:hypothetical protein